MRAENYYHYSYFKTPSRLAEQCLLVSDGMGYTADPDFLIDRKTFYNHLAFYVEKGTFHLRQYGQDFELKEGDCGIISLMDPHLYYSDSKDTAHLLWFHFRGAAVNPIIQLMRENGQLPYLLHDTVFCENFLKAFQLTQSKTGETELASHLYGTVMKILKDYSFETQKDVRMPEELSRAVHFMNENLNQALTLEELSRKAGMGKYHFCHQFKKWYGIAPIQYFNNKKMEKACQMLTERTESIDTIAEILGYLDTGHFRKTFKNYFGVTPAAYRKSKI